MTRSSGTLQTELLGELEAVAQSHDCELLHAEFRGGTLRLVLDRQGGVNLDHCEKVSRDASALLDVEDFGRDRYLLEVSSPGLDRELYRAADWQRFSGRSVKVTYRDDDAGKRTVYGRIVGLDTNGETEGAGVDGIAQIGERDTQATLEIPLDRVHKAKLEIEL